MVKKTRLLPDESYAGGGACGGRESAVGLGPVGQVCPHVALGLQEPIADCLEHQVVIFRPEVLVFHNVVHQMLLKYASIARAPDGVLFKSMDEMIATLANVY